jgi:hypothetical protein
MSLSTHDRRGHVFAHCAPSAWDLWRSIAQQVVSCDVNLLAAVLDMIASAPTPTPAPSPTPSPVVTPGPSLLPAVTTAGSPTSWLDIIQAIGVVVGAILSGAAAVLGFLLFRHERKARTEDATEAAAAQARTVMVGTSFSWNSIKGSEPRDVAGGLELGGLNLNVINYSDHPILDLAISGYLDGEDGRHEVVYVVSGHAGAVRDRVLLPGEHGRSLSIVPVLYQPPGADGEQTYPDLSKVHITITFTDIAGRRWQRTDNQQPVPLRGAPLRGFA